MTTGRWAAPVAREVVESVETAPAAPDVRASPDKTAATAAAPMNVA
jgi:hypothetical protein